MALFMNCCYSHSVLPKDLLNVKITPIIENYKGNKTDINKYRQIMQSSALLKLLELHTLDHLKEKININSRHFRFMKEMSTPDATL